MAFPLFLLIVNHHESSRNGKLWGYSHTVLALDPDSGMIDAMRSLWNTCEELPIDHEVNGFDARIPDGSMKDERMYGLLQEDAYGQRYRWTTAERIALVLTATIPNEPATAYVNVCKPATRVIFGWH